VVARRRVRELGLAAAGTPASPANAITDVPGVSVGHVTLIEGDSIRTGVTAIVPAQVSRAGGRIAAGRFVGNGFGKLIGATQLVELGVIETPIVLTGTLSAFVAADALVTYGWLLATSRCCRSTRSSGRPTTGSSPTSGPGR
jgi:D-aminopeptidase